MRIAYLILAHDNYRNLQLLIDRLSSPDSTFFIHIDAKSKMPHLNSESEIIFIERRKVYWAGFSVVRATLNLLQSAFTHNFDRYILLSGTHLPLMDNDKIIELLNSDKEFISLKKGFSKDKPKRRYTNFYFDCFNRKQKTLWIIKPIEFLISLFYKNRKFNLNNIYQGSQWWALSHNCVSYILNYIEQNHSFAKYFKHSYCPDESFFHTIIGNSDFAEKANYKTTYTDWSRKEKPAILTLEELTNLSENNNDNYLFARKFTDSI